MQSENLQKMLPVLADAPVLNLRSWIYFSTRYFHI